MSTAITLTDICKAPLDALSTAIRDHDRARLEEFRSNIGLLSQAQPVSYTPVTYKNRNNVDQTIMMPTMLLASDQVLSIDTARLDFKVHFSSMQKDPDDGSIRILSSVEDSGRSSMGGHMNFDLKFSARSLPGTEVLIQQTRSVLVQQFLENDRLSVTAPTPQTQLWKDVGLLIADISTAITELGAELQGTSDASSFDAIATQVELLVTDLREFKEVYEDNADAEAYFQEIMREQRARFVQELVSFVDDATYSADLTRVTANDMDDENPRLFSFDTGNATLGELFIDLEAVMTYRKTADVTGATVAVAPADNSTMVYLRFARQLTQS